MSELDQWKPRKVVVVGAGAVGSTFAYALAIDGTANEIALLDADRETASGQVLDLAHGLPFLPPINIHMADKDDYQDASVVVITAGSKQKPGESRLDLLERNAGIIRDIMSDIVNSGNRPVVIMVSNPVDILTYVAIQASGFPRHRVFGSGTVLDTSRFRYIVSEHCSIDASNVHGYILGEHGDSEIAAWSLSQIGGVRLSEYCSVCAKCEGLSEKRDDILKQVRESAYHIIDYKGATCFAVGLALVRIVKAVLRNQRSVLTVSTLLNGEYNIDDICLSVPCVLGQKGIELIVNSRLTDEEQQGLEHSADVLRENLDSLSKD